MFDQTRHPPSQQSDFEPHGVGTPDSAWQAELAHAPEWAPPRSPIVVVAAHPDDETFAAGGLIHSCTRTGQHVTVITVTDGEGARTDLPQPGAIRRRELRAALSCLSESYIEWHRLGVPDGDVANHEDFVAGAIKTRLPRDATLIAPFEHDGHVDHETVGRICVELGRRRNTNVLRYPIWAWHHCAPGHWRGGSFVRFPLNAAAQRAKARAVRCFASQLNATTDCAVMPAHVLSYFSRPYEAFLH